MPEEVVDSGADMTTVGAVAVVAVVEVVEVVVTVSAVAAVAAVVAVDIERRVADVAVEAIVGEGEGGRGTGNAAAMLWDDG